MHIGFRTSGGRGEYEVVGSHSGYSALQLEGWTFSFHWPDGIVRDTGLWLDPAESGKPRLRSMLDNPFQVGRMCAAMLLLPDPRRELPESGNNFPVATEKGYVMTQVGFGEDTEFASVPELVTVHPTYVTLTNLAYTDSIGVVERWRRIEAVYGAATALPATVQHELSKHQALMASGETIDVELTKIVRALARSIEPVVAGYSWQTDCLQILEVMCGLHTPATPGLPPPDELPEDAPDVKARSAHKYRLSKVRGPGQRKFSVAVRDAYRHRCAFCGGQYGGMTGIDSGLEAAHILAWVSYDMDVVENGMSLCKTHHWAFDAGLMVPVHDRGKYRLRFTELAKQLPDDTRVLLGSDGFEIPDDWLPADARLRPSPAILKKYQEDLAVEFIA
jgi:hypothetical protein